MSYNAKKSFRIGKRRIAKVEKKGVWLEPLQEEDREQSILYDPQEVDEQFPGGMFRFEKRMP